MRFHTHTLTLTPTFPHPARTQLAEEERHWEHVVVGLGGLRQLTLDVRTVLTAADAFVTEDVAAAADALLDRATQVRWAAAFGSE